VSVDASIAWLSSMSVSRRVVPARSPVETGGCDIVGAEVFRVWRVFNFSRVWQSHRMILLDLLSQQSCWYDLEKIFPTFAGFIF